MKTQYRADALKITLALPRDVREAIAIVIETSFVFSKSTGTDESGSDLFEDDAETTLHEVAKEIRGLTDSE